MHQLPRQGHIEVICGPMFSGKSETLIGRLRRSLIAKQRVQVFKPSVDDRYGEERIASHSELWLEAKATKDSTDLLTHVLPETKVVGIDEIQFFDDDVVGVVERLADQGKRVVVAGLDLDYSAKPFSIVAELLARAEFVTKTLAVCIQCGDVASRSQRLIASANRVVIGAKDAYEARCRHCHDPRAEVTTAQLFPDSEPLSN
ncbi:MAG: thymidine kinase [Myxococcales bacterium]|nr:MAG: thymidine kinase [Myxococcales bacterium]